MYIFLISFNAYKKEEEKDIQMNFFALLCDI